MGNNPFYKAAKRGRPNVMDDSEVKSIVNSVNEDTPLIIESPNPKRVNTAAYNRYESYMDSLTVGEFIANGGTLADFRYDLKKGFIKIG